LIHGSLRVKTSGSAVQNIAIQYGFCALISFDLTFLILFWHLRCERYQTFYEKLALNWEEKINVKN